MLDLKGGFTGGLMGYNGDTMVMSWILFDGGWFHGILRGYTTII